MAHDYDKLVKRVTKLAVATAILLLLIKIIAWWLTSSMSILASLLDSSIDILASLTNLFMLRYALQPADKEHAFGHGKAEPLSALFQSAFIIGSAVFLLLSSIRRLTEPHHMEQPLIGLIITFSTIVITLLLVSYQRSVIRRTESTLVKSDMLHYKTDLLMNCAVFIALLLSHYNFVYADSILAILIGIYILISAGRIAFEAIQSLLDRSLPDEENQQIQQIVLSFADVSGVHDIKTRRSGKTRFIQLHLELDDNMLLVDAHRIADLVEQALLQRFPGADIIIHQDPISVVPKELNLYKA